jgi:hypothetical protein
VEQQIPLDPAGRADDPRQDAVRDDGTHEIALDLAYQRLGIVNVVFSGVPGAGDRPWALVDAGVMGTTGFIARAAAERFGPDARGAAHVGALASRRLGVSPDGTWLNRPVASLAVGRARGKGIVVLSGNRVRLWCCCRTPRPRCGVRAPQHSRAPTQRALRPCRQVASPATRLHDPPPQSRPGSGYVIDDRCSAATPQLTQRLIPGSSWRSASAGL